MVTGSEPRLVVADPGRGMASRLQALANVAVIVACASVVWVIFSRPAQPSGAPPPNRHTPWERDSTQSRQLISVQPGKRSSWYFVRTATIARLAPLSIES